MLEKIKKWNWPVIWSVVRVFLWGLLCHTLLNAISAPDFEAVRTASTMSNDTIYGFVLAVTAMSVVCLLVQSWKMFDMVFNLPCFARKRKK